MSRERRLSYVAGGLLAAGLAAAAVVASGVIPVEASSGHWRITAWFLHTVMKRSVATRSMSIEPPDLEDPAMLRLGAVAYDASCASCHGAPGRPMPVVPAQMTPHPPELSGTVGEYDPEDLFYIVKHGVKFTGMPAWPALHRDDEIWAVVAFLVELPDMEPAEYQALTAPPADAGAAPEVVVEGCARCHGLDGRGFDQDVFPRLAGQRVAYLDASLDAYAAGERHSGVMQPIAARLTRDQRAEASRWYAEQAPGAPDPADAEAAARGERIARDGGPDGRTAQCVHCHGPKEGPRHPVYPDLAGQPARYLELQLRLFQAGQRGGTPLAGVMRAVASHTLDPARTADVAAFYASQPTAPHPSP